MQDIFCSTAFTVLSKPYWPIDVLAFMFSSISF